MLFRSSGTPSAYRNTRGGRYDYRYDGFGRLVGADYSSDRDGEDFSTEYAYDEIGRPTWVKRWGVVDLDGRDEVFGVADEAEIVYDGALPRVYYGNTGDAEGSNFYGRTGIGVQRGTLLFDGAGRMVSENRGLIRIRHEYNASGRTMAIRRSKLKSSDGSALTQTHDCRGTMLSRLVTQTRASVTDTLVDRRYVGPFTFSGDTLVRVDFAGGFFDSHGYPNYMLPDRLGSVDMVVNFYGFIEQHNGYYPYGEPWREPKGNHLLFAGKERMRHIVRDSDFGPRALNTALCLWNATDRRSETYPWLSPFTYCGANPVANREIDGNWYIKVSTSADRGLYPYGVLTLYSKDDVALYRTVVKARGSGRIRYMTNNDTPQGEYKIEGWSPTGPEMNRSFESFGINPLLALKYKPNQEGGTRHSIHLHGGRKKELLETGELFSTHGCIRINDDDIVELKKITDYLEMIYSDEQPENVWVLDDLEAPVRYQDRDEIKTTPIINLRELIVTKTIENDKTY